MSQSAGKRSRIQSAVDRPARVRPPVDEDEVAGARVHRQPRLGREVPVVPLDQVVHVAEVPVPASSGHSRRTAPGRRRTRPERSPASARRCSCSSSATSIARRRRIHASGPPSAVQLRRRVRPEVPAADAAAARPRAGSRAYPPPAPPLPAVTRRLGPGHALPHDRLALTPIHVASVPAMVEIEGQVTARGARRRAARRGAGWRWRRSASTPTRSLRMEARPVEEFDEDLRRLSSAMRS